MTSVGEEAETPETCALQVKMQNGGHAVGNRHGGS